MTLKEAIAAVYKAPTEYRFEDLNVLVTLTPPPQRDVGRMLMDMSDKIPQAARCMELLRDDAAQRAQGIEGASEWANLSLEEKRRMQRHVSEWDDEYHIRLTRLCLREDASAGALTDEDIRFLLERNPDFAETVSSLCGADREDPTGATDSPLE